jgi:hypothetical protein
LATPWLHLGYTLGRVCEIRHKSIEKKLKKQHVLASFFNENTFFAGLQVRVDALK